MKNETDLSDLIRPAGRVRVNGKAYDFFTVDDVRLKDLFRLQELLASPTAENLIEALSIIVPGLPEDQVRELTRRQVNRILELWGGGPEGKNVEEEGKA